MTTVSIPTQVPAVVHPRRFATNGRIPTALLASSLANLANHVAGVQVHEVFRWAQPAAAIASSATGQRDRWRFAFRAGAYARTLYVRFVLARGNSGGAPANPYARVRIATPAGATVGDATLYFGAGTGGTDTPAFWGVGSDFLNNAGVIATLTPGTDYVGLVSEFDTARLVAVDVYELSLGADTTNGYVDPNFAALGPIYKSARQGLATIARAAWKSGGSHLATWSADLQSTPTTTASATAKNLIDGASTANTTASAGWTLGLAGQSRLAPGSGVAGDVAVRLAVYGSCTTAGQGTVSIAGGGSLAVTGFATSPGWVFATGYLPGSAKYDPMLATAAGTLSVYATSLFLVEP